MGFVDLVNRTCDLGLLSWMGYDDLNQGLHAMRMGNRPESLFVVLAFDFVINQQDHDLDCNFKGVPSSSLVST